VIVITGKLPVFWKLSFTFVLRYRCAQTKKGFVMKVRNRIDNLTQKVWHTIKTFRNSGRHWIQLQKIRLYGVEGIAVIDAYSEVNTVFQRLCREDVEHALMFHRGLFIAVGDKWDPKYGREPLVTDWISDEDDLANLQARLSAFFDLYVCLAIEPDNPPVEIDGVCLAYEPKLLETMLGPGCNRTVWHDSVLLQYPHARIIEYRCKHKQGIWWALEEIERIELYAKWVLPPELRELKDELPEKPKKTGYHLVNSDQVIRPYEDQVIRRYFLEVLHDYYLQMKYWQWGSPSCNRLREEIGEEMSQIGCKNYTAEVFEAVMRDCHSRAQVVQTKNGHRERVRVFV
jgi:hypothetical protein